MTVMTPATRLAAFPPPGAGLLAGGVPAAPAGGWAAVAFWVLAAVAVAGGAAVFAVDSMARATFALLASLLAVGLTFPLIGLEYLGVLIVLMMVMEMLVMAVFMIMYMMNPAGLVPMRMVHNDRGAALIAGGVFVLLTAGVLLVPWPARGERPPPDPTRALGLSIMGPKMLVMMVAGVAILATMISTVVLATDRGRHGGPGQAPGPLGHGGETGGSGNPGEDGP